MKSIFSYLIALTIVGSLLLLTGCLDNDSEAFDSKEQLAKDIAAIDAHLTQSQLLAEKDVNGVRMVIHELGTGLPATTTNTIKVDYVGSVLNNPNPFESGTATGLVSGFIAGWQIALTSLPVGTKATVYIPSQWGYGNRDQGSIPANSILVFEMDFVEIARSASEKERFTNDTTALNNYLLGKGYTDYVKDPSGVRYRITQLGGGPVPDLFDKLKVKLTYKTLTDDKNAVIEATNEPSATFFSRVVDNLPGVVATLRELPEGSKAVAYIPSILGFGSRSVNANNTVIPARTNLIVEMELMEVR